MEDLLNMIEGFIDLVVSLANFVFDLIQDLLYLIDLLATVVLNLPDIFGWMPPAIYSIIASIFGVLVMYKILGREG